MAGYQSAAYRQEYSSCEMYHEPCEREASYYAAMHLRGHQTNNQINSCQGYTDVPTNTPECIINGMHTLLDTTNCPIDHRPYAQAEFEHRCPDTPQQYSQAEHHERGQGLPNDFFPPDLINLTMKSSESEGHIEPNQVLPELIPLEDAPDSGTVGSSENSFIFEEDQSPTNELFVDPDLHYEMPCPQLSCEQKNYARQYEEPVAGNCADLMQGRLFYHLTPHQDPHMPIDLHQPQAIQLTNHTETHRNVKKEKSSGKGAFDPSRVRMRRTREAKLWEFLWDLLEQGKHRQYITWLDVDNGIFKIINSSKVAELWGIHKNKGNMKYEYMARALRFYYKNHIMNRIQNQRLTYQFGSMAFFLRRHPGYSTTVSV